VLTVTARGGSTSTITLADDASVRAIAPPTSATSKPGTSIGSAAMPQDDGSLQALEVQIFPESMRGVGEGQHPFDLKPGSTMTNARPAMSRARTAGGDPDLSGRQDALGGCPTCR